MKILYLNGFIQLPDDFEGTEVDAIKELAERHRKAQSGESKIKPVEGEARHISHDVWEEFLENANAGYKLCMELFCGEYVDGEWVSFKSV